MKCIKFALALTLVPCLGVVSCAEQAEQEEAPAMEMASMDMEALDAEMVELENAWEQAYEGGEAAALAGLYADDAYYMAPYSEAMRGGAELQSYFAGIMDQTSGRQITIERTDYGGSGDMAYSIGTYSVQMQMGDAEEPTTDNGKYLTLARRAGEGSWEIYAHIWNTNKSEAEVARELSAMSEMSEM